MKFKYLFENDINLLEAFELPIAKGDLGEIQSSKIKTIILKYLMRFNEEVPSSCKIKVDMNNTDENYINMINLQILNLYNNMSFAICTNRAENKIFTYKKGIMFRPDEMSKTVVKLIIEKLKDRWYIPDIECSIKNCTVAYTFKMFIENIRQYFPGYFKKSETIYVKFDIRKNGAGWYNSDAYRYTSICPNQHTVRISDEKEKNSKLTCISFHPAGL